ncbi:MAG: hypothetical protein JO025_08920 [Verrucomicrobia bacterium]|nr:hypothetical protein [Verrucomicrobiota bacterium]
MINRASARAIRIIIAFVGGVVFSWLSWCEAVFCGVYLLNLICARSLLALQQEGDLIYRGKLGDLYVQFEWIGVLLAAGASFALFTLEPVGKRKLAVAFYLFLLVLILPLSAANYYPIELWTERLGQAIFDLVLVLLGLAAVQRLLAYKVSSRLGRITRGVAVFLLGAAAVIIPAIYSVIWFLNAHALAKSVAQVHGARPSWISLVAGLVAAAFAILTAKHNSAYRSQAQMDIE